MMGLKGKYLSKAASVVLTMAVQMIESRELITIRRTS